MSAQNGCSYRLCGTGPESEETDDDLTVLALRFCKKQTVNLMIGPPTTSEQDSTYMENFWQKEGKHVICGGTTAKIAARYLRQPLTTIEGSAVDDVPSLMRLPGADLVTEGLLTLERLLEYCEDFREDRLCFHEMLQKKDGAARLAPFFLPGPRISTSSLEMLIIRLMRAVRLQPRLKPGRWRR